MALQRIMLPFYLLILGCQSEYNYFCFRICMRQHLHIAFAIAYAQYTIQPFYCQIGNNISLLLNFDNLGVLEA